MPIDSPFDRPVATKIDNRVRVLGIYVVPIVLLVTAIVYVIGEYQNYANANANAQNSPGSANWILLLGAVLWTLGQLLNLIVLVQNSAGLGFTQNQQARKARPQR